MSPDWIRGRHIVVTNWRDLDHPQAGGAELYCFEAARRLISLGARVTVVTARTPSRECIIVRDGIRIVQVGGRLTVYPSVLWWLWLHRRHVDGVLDCQNGIPFFSPLAVGSRVPVVLLVHHVHQEQFEYHFGPRLAWVGRSLEGWGSRAVYRRRPVVAVSPSTRSEVRARLRLKGPIYVVPNGLLPQGDPPHAHRTTHPSIAVVGRLVPQKRLKLLLEATRVLADRYPDLTVSIVGDGPELSPLRERAAELGLNDRVSFHGRLSDDSRDAILYSAWLTVNPSVREGWGLSVLEANRLGVPAVTFDVPGLRDAVRHGITGWLVGPGRTFADTVDEALAALRNRDTAATYARGAQSWAANFSWDRTGDRIAEVFASEAGNLAARGARRNITDLVAKVHIDEDTAGLFAHLAAGSRASDEWRSDGKRISALLYGTDEDGARRALERMNVSGAAVSLAGSTDLLGDARPRSIQDNRDPIGRPTGFPAMLATPARRWRDRHSQA